ncbi:protocatechuate 3,4-dioxygenase [Thauera sp.]|jgi:protocatechuate 3,4-dioxygenase beta subunit|uniref:protocatechuate 3,4-dioxygenase n=1 Tax=Thauera sp. TaxID=1905334 RepID=UPI002CD9C36C|nr:protocatechuate 3,4-dioxygenase [Thauera sp.]HRO37194.1 protocatechuate 3,4-dioxygenase [Thauera sp.]
MSSHSGLRRRVVLGGSAALLSAPLAAAQRALTPSQMLGPFYPVTPPLHKDNDLTLVEDSSVRADGQISDLSGRVLDMDGQPLAGLRVEIWQCDANGRYRHPRDRSDVEADPNFQGFGHTVTDAEGRYRFRTIRPVPYPGRTPHIHAAVIQEGARPFVTQIYVAGEPLNLRDGLFMRVPEALRPLLLADFVAVDDSVATLSASFDFVLSPVLAGLFEANTA